MSRVLSDAESVALDSSPEAFVDAMLVLVISGSGALVGTAAVNIVEGSSVLEALTDTDSVLLDASLRLIKDEVVTLFAVSRAVLNTMFETLIESRVMKFVDGEFVALGDLNSQVLVDVISKLLDDVDSVVFDIKFSVLI
jgi:hypothetical protein